MTNQNTNESPNESSKPHYLKKYMGTERRSDKIQNTALLELNLDFATVNASSDTMQECVEKLMEMTKARIEKRLRDTDVVLMMSQKFIILLEEVEVVEHAKSVSAELIARLKVPFELTQTHAVSLEPTISINLFSKFDLKLAAFPRHKKID